MSLRRGLIFTFLAQVPTLLLYFVSSTFMTRLLGEEGRGAYALLQNQISLLSMLFGLSFSLGITFYTSKSLEKPERVIRIATTGFLFNLVCIPVSLLVIFGTDRLSQIFLPPGGTQWGYFMYLLLAILSSQINGYVSSIFLGLKKFKVINRLGILSAALNAIGFSALYMARAHFARDQMLPVVLIIGLSCIMAITVIWCITYVRVVGIMPIPTFNWAILKPFLAFVLTSYLSDMINLINYRFDIWVVGSHAGTGELGLYAVAVGLGQLFFYIPDPFSRVVQPYLYEGLTEATIAKFKFISRVNFSVVALLSLTLGLTAFWVIPLLYGKEFLASAPALYFLLPGIVFMSSSKLLTPLVLQGGLIRFYLYATSTAAVATIILDLLLVPLLGIIGASIASTLAYAILMLFQCFVIRFKMGIDVHDMFLLKIADISMLRSIAESKFLKRI